MDMDDLQKAVKEEAERVFRHLAVDYITKHDPQADVSQTYSLPNADVDPLELVAGVGAHEEVVFPSQLQPIFSFDTAEIVRYEERLNVAEAASGAGDARTSMSMHRFGTGPIKLTEDAISLVTLRAPDSKAINKLMGSANNVPFLPAGFEGEVEELLRFTNPATLMDLTQQDVEAEERNFLDFQPLLDIPPGFPEASVDLSNCKISQSLDEMKATPSAMAELSSTMIVNEQWQYLDGVQTTSQQVTEIPIVETEMPMAIEADIPLWSNDQEERVGDSIQVAAENFKPPSEIVPSTAGAVEQSTKMRRTSNDEKYQYAKLLDATKPQKAYEELLPRMARKFTFALDPFQQQAVLSMEEGNSVFVAAHTSAGKTVIAEYAVALCEAHRTRVIYTSPIKALSNQKFRDFKIAFKDVGLVTGDIQLRPEASCLIMTTEILRSMLFNGSEAIRELEWVIFDEVHYINDAERGHVWEEVLIMLPSHVKIAMLSATVPNCVEFADWVGRIKNRVIGVIQTTKRPVPLEHFIYTGQDGKSRDNRFKVMGEDGQFMTWSYNKAAESMKPKEVATAIKGGAKSQQQQQSPQKRRAPNYGANWNQNRNRTHGNEKNIYINLIDHLRRGDLLPMVVFIFSRKRCDETAVMLKSVDLTTAKEKAEIRRFFHKCIDRLSGPDKELPQVRLMQEHCLRGLAVHHSGILPIVKEVVELLFQKGLVKILFATETFAMGVNMPARTVVFDTLEKFDGTTRRYLNSTEYVQMAGRAGRRGLDSTGTVIIISKGQPPDLLNLTKMLCGKTIALESRFRITYGMLLNLSRVEQLRIEDVLQRSFVERASLRLVVGRKDKIKQITQEISKLSDLSCPNCMPHSHTHHQDGSGADIMAYVDLLRAYLADRKRLLSEMSLRVDKLFAPGRLLILNQIETGLVDQLAVVLQCDKSVNKNVCLTVLVGVGDEWDFYSGIAASRRDWNAIGEEEKVWAREHDRLIDVAKSGGRLEKICRRSGAAALSTYHIIEDVELDDISVVFKDGLMKFQLDANELIEQHRQKVLYPGRRSRSPDLQLTKLLKMLELLEKKWSAHDAELPLLILSDDGVRSGMGKELKSLREMRAAFTDGRFACVQCPQFIQHMEQVLQRLHLEEQKQHLQYQLSTESLIMEEERKRRLEVLRDLGYLDSQGIIELKGKVACEIHEQELLLTELMLDNKFASRSCAEMAAMLSPITCQFQAKSITGEDVDNGDGGGEGGDEEAGNSAEPAKIIIRAPKELIRQLRSDIVEVARRIDAVQRRHGVCAPLVEDQLSFDIMETAYQWASGMPFSDIMRLTDAQEGLIVRCIQRLDELCKDVRNASRIVGDPSLYEKMEETSASIRRDIVFAASLYTAEGE